MAQAEAPLQRNLDAELGSASYCCESAGGFPVAELPLESAFPPLRRELSSEQDSASYCCESAEVVPVSTLPAEHPF